MLKEQMPDLLHVILIQMKKFLKKTCHFALKGRKFTFVADYYATKDRVTFLIIHSNAIILTSMTHCGYDVLKLLIAITRVSGWKLRPKTAAVTWRKVLVLVGVPLLRLPYFDPIRFAPVDLMHNCFLGVAKRVMCTVWRDESRSVAGGREALITRSQLAEMSKASETLVLPLGYDGTSIIRKMNTGENGFSNMTADEWRVWITAMSPYLLSMRLSTTYLNNWMYFVKAVRLLCMTSITYEELEEAHYFLQKFLNEFVSIYGDAGYLTINFHNLLHIKEGILDFGPAMTHWVFNFERYNRDLKNININNKGDVEYTIIKKYLYLIHAQDYFDIFFLKLDGFDAVISSLILTMNIATWRCGQMNLNLFRQCQSYQ
ncbi:uncharacterized protein BX663DRAFT_172413 [Cokeromyces recurvatus]|uniref:uncharacterized protein n=1 Tax=Cokeromyces recurvatus TaxID=90255 RepID=UPI00221E9FA3|nr:uncharacterized protein BX663DRAFT_172413 [Cokeromyces recurvatus]KAI7900014.1 hypothetical protein BX663DRAFT_172413 [Cokeromyces recurvatus]